MPLGLSLMIAIVHKKKKKEINRFFQKCYSLTGLRTSSSSSALPRVAVWDVGCPILLPTPWEALEITLRAFCISLQIESLLAVRDATSECSKQAEHIECRREEFSFRDARAAAISSRWLLDFKSCQQKNMLFISKSTSKLQNRQVMYKHFFFYLYSV